MAGDYIRRDLAKKRFSKRLMWLKEDVHDEYSGALLDGCETDIELLDEIPAADVVEAVHAKWIPFHSEAAGDIQYCSACDIGFDARMDYCPHCRARMDGWMEDADNG